MTDVVRYTGTAGSFRMTRRQWEQAGVEGQDTVTWNAAGNWDVPLDELNDRARELVTKHGSAMGLRLVDSDSRAGRTIPKVIEPPIVGHPPVTTPIVLDPPAEVSTEPEAAPAPRKASGSK